MITQVDPVCTILGGANGCGKSTIYPSLHASGEFVNADIVARQINPADPVSESLEAGRRVLRRLDELVQSRDGFVYETTLSGTSRSRSCETPSNAAIASTWLSSS